MKILCEDVFWIDAVICRGDVAAGDCIEEPMFSTMFNEQPGTEIQENATRAKQVKSIQESKRSALRVEEGKEAGLDEKDEGTDE